MTKHIPTWQERIPAGASSHHLSEAMLDEISDLRARVTELEAENARLTNDAQRAGSGEPVAWAKHANAAEHYAQFVTNEAREAWFKAVKGGGHYAEIYKVPLYAAPPAQPDSGRDAALREVREMLTGALVTTGPAAAIMVKDAVEIIDAAMAVQQGEKGEAA